MAHHEPLRLAAEAFPAVGDVCEEVGVAGEHHRGRAVDRRDADAVADEFGGFLLGGLHREHRAPGGQRLHQATAGRDQLRRVRQRQDTGDVRGGDLADGVAREVVGAHPPALHEPVQRDLDGEQGRLREFGAGQRFLVVAPHHLAQRARKVRVELRARRVQRRGERGEAAVQRAAHPQPLGPLPGEHERRRALLGGEPAREFGEAVGSGQQHRAVLERRPRLGEGQRDVGERRGGVLGEVDAEPVHLRGERFGAARGHRQRHELGQHAGFARLLHDGRGLLDDHVRVGAADAERRDPGAARAVALRPVALLGEQLDRSGAPVHVGRRGVHVQAARQHAVPHRQHHLDHTGDPGGGLRVADVRLDRPEPQRRLAVLAVGRQQGLRLDRVTERGARAVRLHYVHIGRFEVRVAERGADDALLRRPVRRRQPVRRAVLVDRRPAHHRQHRVPVALRVGQPLQQQNT
ncbi:hypothetical protein GCM10027271_22890 [Saccharopolyspora gloriosae]